MTTPPPLTDEQLAAIRARRHLATGGTWYLQPDHGPDFVAAEHHGYEHGIGDLAFGAGDQADADREFVLNAHDDVTALLVEVDRLRAERDQARAELALATVFEIPRPGNAAPLQIRQIYDDTDRWAICDRTGRRRGRDGGWWYEPEREELCDSIRFTLAEALPLAQQLAQDDKAARTVPDAP